MIPGRRWCVCARCVWWSSCSTMQPFFLIFFFFCISFWQLLFPSVLPLPSLRHTRPSPTLPPSCFTILLLLLLRASSVCVEGTRKGAWPELEIVVKYVQERLQWGRIDSLPDDAGAFAAVCSREGSWQDYKYKIKSRTLMNILFLVGGRREGAKTSFLTESQRGRLKGLKWEIYLSRFTSWSHTFKFFFFFF